MRVQVIRSRNSDPIDELRKLHLMGVSDDTVFTVKGRFNAGGFLTLKEHTVVDAGGRRLMVKVYGEGKVVPDAYSMREAKALSKATREYNDLLTASGINVPALIASEPIADTKKPGRHAVVIAQEMIGDGLSVLDYTRRPEVPDEEILRLHQAILSATHKAANSSAVGNTRPPFDGQLVLETPERGYVLQPPFNAALGIDNKPQNMVMSPEGVMYFIDSFPPFHLTDGKFAVDEILRRRIRKDSPFDLFYWHMCDKRLLYCKPHLITMMVRPELLPEMEKQATEFVRQNEHPKVAAAVRTEIKSRYPLAKQSLDVLDGIVKIP